MTTHLSATVLNALVDGELPVEQSAATKEHLDQCPSCTSSALSQALLKTATAKAGQRYTLPPQLQERLRRVASSQDLDLPAVSRNNVARTWSIRRIASLALPIAAVLLVLASASLLIERYTKNSERASVEASCAGHGDLGSAYRHACVRSAARGDLFGSSYREALVPGKTSLQLQSSGQSAGRYTAGWRQSHVSPQSCGGAAALQHRPPSRFCIHPGTIGVGNENPPQAEHSGFHVTGFDTSDLEVTAISDVDPSRLSGLVRAIEEAQMKH